MSSIFINPNWHPALIHFPLCLLVVGLGIEWLTVFFRRPSIQKAGRWILLLGALSAVAVAFSGIYALDDVVYRSQRPEASQASERPWRDLAHDARLHGGQEMRDPSAARADRSRTDEAWRMLAWHAWLEGGGVALIVAVIILATALSGRMRHRLMFPFRLLLLAGLGAMLWGAWFSGETVYRDATATQLKGAGEPRPGAAANARLAAQIGQDLEYFLGPPLQTHVFIAGVTVAAAAGALLAAILGFQAAVPVALPTSDEPTRGPPVEEPTGTLRRNRLAARLWLTGALLALLTGFLGLWNLSRPDEANSWSPPKLWATIIDRSDNPDGPINRRTAHVIGAICIVTAMLCFAAIARWRGQSRRLLAALGLALLLLVAVQVWLGILLLFDGKGVKSGQPFYRFRPASESAMTMQERVSVVVQNRPPIGQPFGASSSALREDRPTAPRRAPELRVRKCTS